MRQGLVVSIIIIIVQKLYLKSVFRVRTQIYLVEKQKYFMSVPLKEAVSILIGFYPLCVRIAEGVGERLAPMKEY